MQLHHKIVLKLFFAGFEIFEFNTYTAAQQNRQLFQDGAWEVKILIFPKIWCFWYNIIFVLDSQPFGTNRLSFHLFCYTIFSFLGVKQSPLMLTSECVDSRSGQRLRWKNADVSHFCTKVNRTKIVLRSNPKDHFQPQYICCNSKYMFFLRFHLKIIVKHFVKNIFLSHLICLAHQVLL